MIIQKDFPLSQILWYKFGPLTKYLLTCENSQDIYDSLKFVSLNKIQNVHVIGLGSNLIFTGDIFDGAVIRIVDTVKNDKNIEKDKDIIKVYSGMILDDLIAYSFENYLTGLEWAGGLPGTVGGGVRGNVGAFGKEIKESVVSAEILEIKNENFSIKTFKFEDLNFSYRNSLVKQSKNMIILSVTFKLLKSAQKELDEAKNIYEKNINYRKTHHPVEYPTCGSVFKNITGKENITKILKVWPDINELIESKWHGKVPVGYISKRLGLSGFQVGDMQVSPKHSNFIINLGKGKASDAVAIIKEVQNKINGIFGFTPEIEAEII